jgi:hypothetical protein
MKRFLALLMIFSLISMGRTQDGLNEYKHSLGLHAGIASGYGFSYRFWPKKIGFQITGIPILSTNQITTSSGLSFLLKINDFSKVSLYSYLGNHLRYERYNYSDPTNEYYQKMFSYYSAIGVGVRINFLQVLDFNFQAGYGIGFRNSSSTVPYEPVYNDYNTTLDVGAGLYFHF